MTQTTQDKRKQDLLDSAEAKFGFVPNVLRQMSTSPAALQTYLHGQAALSAEGNRLSDRDRNQVQLAVSQVFGCKYCVAAHTAIGRGVGSPAEVLSSLGSGDGIPQEEGGAYVDAARLLIQKQGNLTTTDLQELEARGVDREAIYEIISSVGIKLITNWINHIAKTKVDEQFS